MICIYKISILNKFSWRDFGSSWLTLLMELKCDMEWCDSLDRQTQISNEQCHQSFSHSLIVIKMSYPFESGLKKTLVEVGHLFICIN